MDLQQMDKIKIQMRRTAQFFALLKCNLRYTATTCCTVPATTCHTPIGIGPAIIPADTVPATLQSQWQRGST
jgi:hypothetical protein